MKTSSVTSRDGQAIAYSRLGTGGKHLVFLHGLGDDRHVWDATVARLATAGMTCVAIDLRGHGESSNEGDFDPFSMAEDVKEVVRELRLERPILVGHSLGGFVATAAAAAIPVAGVVNVDQMLRLSMLGGFAREREDQLRNGAHHEVLVEILQIVGVDQIPLEQRTALLAKRSSMPRKVVLGVWRRLLECTDQELERLIAERLRLRNVPYLALHGSDPGPDYASWLGSLIDGAELVVWGGVGHYPQLVDLDRFVELTHSFVNRS